MRKPRIGLAIGDTSITASTGWSVDIPPITTTPAWSEFEEHLRSLRTRVGKASVCVALMPELASIRRIDLPHLRDTELNRLLHREVGRHFILTPYSPLLAYCRVGRGSRASDPVLLSCISSDLLGNLVACITAAGLAIERIGPALQSIALDSVKHSSPEGQILVLRDSVADLMRTKAGKLTAVRCVPRSLDRIEAALRESSIASVVVYGDDAELYSALEGRGFSLSRSEQSAEEVGTKHVMSGWPLEFVPPDVNARRSSWAKQLQRGLWMATAAVLMLSAGLVRWDLARQLKAVMDERATIRQKVTIAMDARKSLENSVSRLNLLRKQELTAARWTGLLGSIAENLPDDAFLTGLRAEGDSLLLEGEADNAAGVFESLSKANGILGLRANAPIRQQQGDGVAPIERFSLKARIQVADSVPAAES